MKKTQITICQGSSCFSRGNKQNLAIIQDFLKTNKLDADVSFKGQLCTDFCNDSPIVVINDKIYTQIDEVQTFDILKNHFKL